MRNKMHFFKRVTALFLSLIMVLAPGANVIAAGLESLQQQSAGQVNDGKWHGTVGELLAANYDLSDAEKAILACKGLVGETFAVEIPTNEGNSDLVTVDAENETVTARPYEVNGQTWTPSKAVLKYTTENGTDGADIEVPLTASEGNYVGFFEKPANSYRVEVTYSLLITVDNALQKLLLDTPFYLVDGYDKVNNARNLFSTALDPFEEMIEDLRALYEGVLYEVKDDEGTVLFSTTIGLEDGSDAKVAIKNLLDDFDGDPAPGHFTLAKDCNDFLAAASKVQFMMERGKEMKEHIAFFAEQISTINENSDDLQALADQLKTLADGPADADDNISTIADAKVIAEEKAEEVIADTILKPFKDNNVEIDEAAVKNAIVSKWPGDINGLVTEIFGIVETTVNNVANEKIEEVIDSLLNEERKKILDADASENLLTAADKEFLKLNKKLASYDSVAIYNEMVELAIIMANTRIKRLSDESTEYGAMIKQYNVDLSGLKLDTLRGKHREANPNYKQEMVNIRARYENVFAPLNVLFIFNNDAYPELQSQIALAKNSLDTLEKSIDDMYVEVDKKPQLKADKILEAWRTIADDKEKKLSLTEAQDSFKNALSEKFNESKEKFEEALTKVEEKRTEALAKAEQLEGLLYGSDDSFNLSDVAEQVNRIAAQNWHFIDKDILKSGISDAEYAELDAAVKASPELDRPQVEIKSQLLAHETMLQGLVSQQLVSVEVHASVVPSTATDLITFISLDVFSTSFAMDKDSLADAVVTKINSTGIENKALTEWDSYYNVGTTNYERKVTVLDKDGNELGAFSSLTEDIRYVISYSPKTFTVTENYKPQGQQTTDVPYGYNFTLTPPTEAGKSYDYKVNGYSYLEGTVYRIVEDITVERVIGKALVGKDLAKIIAQSLTPGSVLTQDEKNILNTGAFKVDTLFFRTPDSTDKLTKVTGDASGYQLTASPMAAGLLNSEAKWIPVKAYPIFENGNGAEFILTQDQNSDKYVGGFATSEKFTKVQVIYQLKIDNVEQSIVSKLADIAATLVEDTVNQKAAMDSFYVSTPGVPVFYTNLEQLTPTVLGNVNSLVTLTPEAQAAYKLLMDECMDIDNDTTYLHQYLKAYEEHGLLYYYQGKNAENIQKQIALLKTNLRTVWHDEPVQLKVNNDESLKGYVDKVEAVLSFLDGVHLDPVNELVDTDSRFVADLLAAVDAANSVGTHSVSQIIEMETSLLSAAPDQYSFGVTVQVLNKNGAIVSTESEEMFRDKNSGSVSPAEFQAMYERLLNKIPNVEYYDAQFDLPEENVPLGEDPTILVAKLSPVSYTVKIDGEADQKLYAFDAYTVTLPGTGALGFKYIYDIAGTKVEVSSGSFENYSLGTSIETINNLFGSDRVLEITREKIDINREGLLVFIDDLNKAVVNAGLLFGNNLELAFIPTEDAQGNLSIVLRISKSNAALDLDAFLAELVTLMNDLTYVGLNGSTLFGLNENNETKLYLQTLINFITSSGMGIDMIPAIIQDNGDLVEMTLPEHSVIGTDGNHNIIVNGAVINDVNLLGAKLMESTMQYGLSVNNYTSVPFYVTLQDFDKMSDVFSKVRKGAEQILPYLNVTLKDGKVNVILDAPDPAYAYFLTALLAVGEIDFDTLQTYDLADVIDYIVSLVDPAFASEGVDADTLINTIKKTGFYDAIDRFDFEANKALINTIYNIADYSYESAEVTGSAVGGLYDGTVKYNDLKKLFSKNDSFALFEPMVAELNTGISTGFTFHLKNRDANYEALVLDIRGNGIASKYSVTKDVAATVQNVKDNAIVILLSDVQGDLVFNNDVILNLNGHDVNGNLVANGNVVIVDSTLSTDDCGSVTGTLTAANGSFRIGSGKFASDVSAYLDTGFTQTNGAVQNCLYKLVKNGDDIGVYFGSASVSADKASLKVMAVDLVTKLVMNFYACSELTVNGDGIYGVDLKNVTESLDDLTVLVSKIVECIDCAGSSSFATKLLNELTDFAAISEAIQNGTPFASYTLVQSGFNPYLTVESENGENFFAFNVNSSSEKKNTTLKFYVSEDLNANYKDLACDILAELDKITTFNELKVDLKDVTFKDGNGLKLSNFDITGNAQADLIVDLTGNFNYPVILAAILAYNSNGAAQEEYVNAITDYRTSTSTKALMAVLEKATASEIIAALKATKNKTFASILASLDLTAPEAEDLEALYTIARKLLGYVADAANVNGPASQLSGLKLSGVYGTYGVNVNRGETYGKITLEVFTEEKAIVVKNSEGLVVMTGDDLADVLANVKDDYTVYVNSGVTLASDIHLPVAKFNVVKAKNIDFNGKTLWFDDVKTVLSIDKDISASVKNDPAVFCSEVSRTAAGDMHIFQIPGEKHKWVTDPAVEPDCHNPGSTEGIICEYCGEHKEGHVPQEIPALDHKGFEQVIPAVPATKDTVGWTEGLKCSKCGDILVYPTELAKLPYIHVPTVTVDPVAGVVRGAKVDTANKIVYLDSDPTGLTGAEFAKVFFKIDNASDDSITLKGANGTVRSANDPVCNGDTVTVWAKNKDNVSVSVTYSVIIMGDTNCDGKVNARDLSLTDAYVVGYVPLSSVAILAADMNFDGKINARDLSATDFKVVYWERNSYVSQIK